MNYHLRTTPSLKRKNRKKGGTGIFYEKLDKNFKSSNKIPSYETPREDLTEDIPSVPMDVNPDSTARKSIMESVLLGKESQETKDEVIRKSKCLAPAYNKGAVQYVGSEESAKDIGRK